MITGRQPCLSEALNQSSNQDSIAHTCGFGGNLVRVHAARSPFHPIECPTRNIHSNNAVSTPLGQECGAVGRVRQAGNCGTGGVV